MEEHDRRRFLHRSWKALATIVVAEGAIGSWQMLRPANAGAFGGIVKVGDPADFPEGTVRYFSEGRFYVTSHEGRLSALYQKCPHLGCRVPFCTTSSQFECPCHGSAYNIIGEYIRGPAARGMDRFPVTVEGGQVTVDTETVLEGPQRGVLTGPSEATGPACNGVYPALPGSGAHEHGGEDPSHAPSESDPGHDEDGTEQGRENHSHAPSESDPDHVEDGMDHMDDMDHMDGM